MAKTRNGNARIIEITPKMAMRYLETNNHNRRLSEQSVRELTAAIKNDEWQLNGEAIKIDGEGNLLDGQHRLHAIAKSGRSVKTYVISNLDSESFKTIDTGKRRNNADALSLLGYRDPTMLAAAARLVVNVERNQLRSPRTSHQNSAGAFHRRASGNHRKCRTHARYQDRPRVAQGHGSGTALCVRRIRQGRGRHFLR
ncbi:MAG: ParB N-terminal domain-containing protein [Pseudomonadota bacterium]